MRLSRLSQGESVAQSCRCIAHIKQLNQQNNAIFYCQPGAEVHVHPVVFNDEIDVRYHSSGSPCK